MARAKPPEDGRRRRKPATTPEDREAQLVSLAYDVAEEQLMNGTASSQVITQMLKLGSSRERLEQQRLTHENELTKVKIEAMESATRMEELYANAIRAMSMYQGKDVTDDETIDDEED